MMTAEQISKARQLQRDVNASLDRAEHVVNDPTTTAEGLEAVIQETKRLEDLFWDHIRACHA